ncbi:MAG: signal peptidase I [Bacteroidia bacterium]|nr:signal peptidase I [Bacteroidia bacterium]
MEQNVPFHSFMKKAVIKKPVKKKKSSVREWLKAIFIAVLFLIVIRIFAFQSFVVSDSKMESTLFPGDYVVINKLGYGSRLPITLLSFPFVGSTFSFSDSKAYSELIQLPYFRFPGFSDISRNDIVFFNYPLEKNIPIDKRTQILKRCVALPGDTLAIVDKKVFVNRICINDATDCNYRYRVVSNNILPNSFFEKYKINEGGLISEDNIYNFFITRATSDSIVNDSNIKQINLIKLRKGDSNNPYFPQSENIKWSLDYFGPITIPEKGKKVTLNYENIELYRAVIDDYENNNIFIKNKKIFINNIETSEYIFKMDYYFMLDDNRDNGKDSRYWGFVPENHIIGKAGFIWFSISKSKNSSEIMWSRLFKTF